MRLVILDRDGVINHDSDDFIKSPDEWQPIEGSMEAIANMYRAGYHIVIITNQSGVGRKLFSTDTLNLIHIKMLEHIRQHGGEIEAILFCPHAPDDNCECRKPKPDMFIEMAVRLNITLENTPAVGDSIRDLQAAIGAGATPILVKTGKGEKSLEALKKNALEDVLVFDDLLQFSEALINNKIPGLQNEQ